MELPRIASHTSISPTNIELLNYNHNTISSSGSGDDTELLLLKPARGTPANRRPLSACITDYGGSSSGGAPAVAAAAAGGVAAAAGPPAATAGGAGVTFTAPTFTIIPGVGAAFQPSRKREEACAIQNLKRRVQQLRLLKANQQEPIECNINARDRDNNAQDLDNRPQLFQKIAEDVEEPEHAGDVELAPVVVMNIPENVEEPEHAGDVEPVPVNIPEVVIDIQNDAEAPEQVGDVEPPAVNVPEPPEEHPEVLPPVIAAPEQPQERPSVCTICRDDDATFVCVPCGHFCLCLNCSEYINQLQAEGRCPTCRGVLIMIMRVYGM